MSEVPYSVIVKRNCAICTVTEEHTISGQIAGDSSLRGTIRWFTEVLYKF